MMHSKFPRILIWASALFASTALSSCGGGGGTNNNGTPGSSGPFEVLSSTLSEGDVWALNRPIDLVFNHPVDPASISFSSIILKPTSPAILSQPVTGSFSLLDGFGGTVVRFTPACPSNEALSNGGFVPGGFTYTLTLPSESAGVGLSVLRDDQGRPLSIGLTRNFTTPLVGEPLFIDSVLGPPRLVSREVGDFPEGLNLFSESEEAFVVRFDQPIETSPTNLSPSRLFFLYSEADGVTFPATNVLPGQWLVLDNCDLDGATLRFEPSGILPPGRMLRLQVSPLFVDLSGESNTTVRTYLDAFGQPDDFELPDLNEFYGDSTNWDTTITYDQFTEDFETPLDIDLNADLPLPQVDLPRGSARASFDYPGLTDVPAADDFFVAAGTEITLNTDGTLIINDSNGRPFTLEEGVLNVNDITIEAGGVLRAEGSNPLVLYATGTVDIQGTLDASGDHALSPVALSQPQIPEVGANGQAGGGDGGTASLLTGAATLRGQTGFGAFGSVNGGGQGGEGGFQQDFLVTTEFPALREFLVSAGGGGGGFADGFNESILWEKWSGEENLFVLLNGVLTQVDDSGPDSRYLDRHTTLDPFTDLAFAGAEDGLRGSSWDSTNALHEDINAAEPSAVYGMEDATRDQDVDDGADKFDPPWNNGAADPVFSFGNPTAGPDPGRAGASVFESSGTTADDFWGRRVNPDGTTTVGELAGPLAGSGGGASGDLHVLVRQSFIGPMGGIGFFPLTDSWPDPGFPVGLTDSYFKGAPGGGGGGQMLVFSVGPIVIGSEAVLKVNGGNGAGGEAVFRGHEQVSGSGGGSGGHMVLHSASQLDLSAIDLGLGGGATIAQITDRDNANEVAQALGGRRGWSMTFMPTPGTNKFMDNENRDNDGNSDYMAGRGGAGANGIIQVHVPNPLNDIIFHPNLEPAITTDITIAGVTDYADNDNLEAVMRAFMVPTPRVLVPVYATGSQLQSKWIDTGLALKRNPVGAGSGEFISYSDAGLSFDGIQTGTGDPAQDGRVETTGTDVDGLTAVASGASGLTLSSFSAVISSASSRFGGDTEFLTNPQLLLGYDLLPVALARPDDSFQIVAVTYDETFDRMTVTTATSDGDMTDVPGAGGGATWQIRPKFFRFNLDAVKDQLPADGYARIEFQGDDESAPGSNVPSGTPTPWTTDLADLEGKRFFRYRITIEMSESGTGFELDDPRPVLEYFKLPFAW